VGAAHEVEAEVDAGRRPGAGGDVAVLDVEDAGHGVDVRERLAELGLVEPVGGGLAALEHARARERERARAERDDGGAAGDRALQGADQLRRRLVVAAGRRDDDEVRLVQRLQPVGHDDLEAELRPHRLRPRRADRELEPGDPLGAAVDAEHLAGDGELERRDGVVDDDGHLLEPQRGRDAAVRGERRRG
jgi:hypothetical protein